MARSRSFSPKYVRELTNTDIQRYAPAAFATEAHASRSANYEFIPTFKVIDAMRAAGFVPVRAMQSGTRLEGHEGFVKHMITFRAAGDVFKAFNVGDLMPELNVINAHNGGTSYQVMGAIWRKVCGNGMVVSESMLAAIRVPHISRRIEGDVIEGSFRVVEGMPNVLASVDNWRALPMPADYRDAYARHALEVRWGNEAAPIQPAQFLRPRRYEDRNPDVWTTFNVVQEHMIRGKIDTGTRNKAGGRITTRPINGVDNTIQMNRRLWALTDHYANAIRTNSDPTVLDLGTILDVTPIRAETLPA